MHQNLDNLHRKLENIRQYNNQNVNLNIGLKVHSNGKSGRVVKFFSQNLPINPLPFMVVFFHSWESSSPSLEGLNNLMADVNKLARLYNLELLF